MLFRLGYSPLVFSWTSLAVYAMLGLVQKPWLIMRMVDYKWREIWGVYRSCIIVTAASLPIPLIVYRLVNATQLVYFILIGFVCVLSVGISVYTLGVDRATRSKVMEIVRCRFSNKD